MALAVLVVGLLPQGACLRPAPQPGCRGPTPTLSPSIRQLEQLEAKRSGLAKELAAVREALSCAELQRDVLQAEKAGVAEALTKVCPWVPLGHRPALPEAPDLPSLATA